MAGKRMTAFIKSNLVEVYIACFWLAVLAAHRMFDFAAWGAASVLFAIGLFAAAFYQKKSSRGRGKG